MATSHRPWAERYDLLTAFINENGLAALKTDTVYGGFNLGHWVRDQRRDGRNGKLSDERRKMLAKVGVKPDAIVLRTNLSWDDRYKELSKFTKKHGRLPQVGSDTESEAALANWVNNQKSAGRAGRLADGRIDQLSKVGVSLERVRTLAAAS